MHALLGQYDWSHVPALEQAEAGSTFTRGMQTLKRILPYYDVGGFSAYDMAHITQKADPFFTRISTPSTLPSSTLSILLPTSRSSSSTRHSGPRTSRNK